jgi:hypothetical protein
LKASIYDAGNSAVSRQSRQLLHEADAMLSINLNDAAG